MAGTPPPTPTIAAYLASLEPFRRQDRYDVRYDVPAEVMFATARKPR
jgi:hypothetical protein